MAAPLLLPVLLLVVVPMVKKILITFGVGIITYVGVTAALNAVSASIGSNLASMSGFSYVMISKSGFVEGVGILVGAISARSALILVKRWGFV